MCRKHHIPTFHHELVSTTLLSLTCMHKECTTAALEMSHLGEGNGLSNKPVFPHPLPSPTANTAKTLKLIPLEYTCSASKASSKQQPVTLSTETANFQFLSGQHYLKR